ncbi:ATP-binding protein [Acutalibacter intestini]|uniref:ATP-binding protein n=1 Tax=Acutalibacter intestini TaxID=3093659 RepID=UPI002AC8F1C8|nr:AAA family ATPase [Acutalibacter sp. M00204]
MKITSISCTQFAGMRDRRVELEDGVNVLFGKNETGKTTLVNLLLRTLFQSPKLDNRRDKEFRSLYFPSERRDGGQAGDFADGTVCIETEAGPYRLEKEWGPRPCCTLSTPQGVLRDQNAIDGILKDVLRYGEGVYSDLLSPSQKNLEPALQSLLSHKESGEAKQELAAVAAQAFAESGGASLEAIERGIRGKIEEIAGKHWDSQRGEPARGRSGRWSKDLGSVLKGYYRMEDARAVLEEVSRLEKEADEASARYVEAERLFLPAEEDCRRFGELAGRLEALSERREAEKRLEADWTRQKHALEDWPQKKQELERAKNLDKERQAREALERFQEAEARAGALAALRSQAEKTPCPLEEELDRVRKAQRCVAQLENSLGGMNLSGGLDLLEGHKAWIKSLRTGERVELPSGAVTLTEAVEITIPGVMKLRLAPGQVDAARVQARLAEERQAEAVILEKYRAKSLEELEAFLKDRARLDREMGEAEYRLERALDGQEYQELKEAAKAAPDVRSKEEVEAEAQTLCAGRDLGGFIAARETVLEGYIKEYGSWNALKNESAAVEEKLEKVRQALKETENIPEGFLDIPDPQAHLKRLETLREERRAAREMALTAKAAAQSRLEAYKENLEEDPAAAMTRAVEDFEAQKELLGHWLHIEEVFLGRKEALSANPMQRLAQNFAYYLEVLSKGQVQTEFLQGDRLDLDLYSKERLVDYGKLSQGTKETVSLAFRLAALDQLFPQGGGVLILDDPFTDMDQERMEQACGLVRECGKRHQVIFLTCREEYYQLLEGNRVVVE